MTRPFVSSPVPVLDWFRRDAKPSEWSLFFDGISKNIVLHHGWSEKNRRRLLMGLEGENGELFDLVWGKLDRLTRASSENGHLVDFEAGPLSLLDLVYTEEFLELKKLRSSGPGRHEQARESFERMFGKFCLIASKIHLVDSYVFRNLTQQENSPAEQIVGYLAERKIPTSFHSIDPTIARFPGENLATAKQKSDLVGQLESAGIAPEFYKPRVPGRNGRGERKFPHPRVIRFDFAGGDSIVVVLDQGLESFGQGTVNTVAEAEDGGLVLWGEIQMDLKATEIDSRFPERPLEQ